MTRLLNKFIKDYEIISKYYKFLVEKVKQHNNVGIVNEWLIDNFYLVVEYKNDIIGNKSLSKTLKKSKEIYKAINEIVIRNNYNINYKLFVKELNSYQRKNKYYFSYQELSMTKIILIGIYNARLSELCKKNYNQFLIKDSVAKNILTLSDKEEISIDDFISKQFDPVRDHYYTFEINNQLKELGTKARKFFKNFNEKLEEKNVSLKDILNSVYQSKIDDTVLISNLFTGIKNIRLYDLESIYSSVSKCEKVLLEDKTYFKMAFETKNMYRSKIVKLSKKNKVTEYEYVSKLYSDNSDNNNYHIGFSLFKEKDTTLRMILYIFFVTIFSIISSFLLSMIFIPNIIIGFLILIIPTSQLVLQIVNLILEKFVGTEPSYKLNYLKGIPEEDSTMIVIPTIISDTTKIKEMFDKLETFYLINKSDNLYFTLLGDVKKSSKEVEDYDKEISAFGLEYASKLNKKYKKDLFYFVYRKRVYNESENGYLGYERKRGAILQFNRILLNKLSKKDLKKYFNVNTLENASLKIKYVITLDTDTEPVLNSILNLVGCMAHPLNKPILNKEETKVVKGHALMQPRISTDIESTNRSLYSQIFAGIGGFDTYTSSIPNIYQDLFKEGSFVGKGIYDLDVFDKLLYERFPDNLILSHDLLEGSYLRCAYVSDIEFIDDFPSKFLVDTSRQHRWARGDVQILDYMFPKAKNYKGKKEVNPTNLLERFKIFDNIVRMFLSLTLFIIVLLNITICKNKLVWFIYVLLIIAFSIVSFLKSKLYLKDNKFKTVYYKNLMFGGKAILLRAYVVFATIPYYTKLYLDAFIRSIYRMKISHKNLLNWITAEEVAKTAKFDLKTYCFNFSVNLITGLILFVVSILTKNISMFIVGLIFISAPFVTYLISKDLKKEKKLNSKEDAVIEDIALKTWDYFKENLREEYNYLIPDNYQENRDEKLDFRTSPTDIAFSITSIISAYNLDFISRDEAIDYLEKIIESVSKLEKWHGHLYNWYDTKTMEVLNPKFISTIDSGNFVASLIVALTFVSDGTHEALKEKIERLIKNTNFRKLYTKTSVLSIGYDVSENHMSPYNYNKFASESRLTSFIAIAKGDIPSKHWFCLDKSLTTYKNHKGLISWSGTAFEYYMPFLFMKNYPNTLLDESYSFAYICQKEYMESVDKNLPFGISESAYNELDNSLNYKYHSFSVPYLKSREELNERIVISPYSTLMELELYPKEIYNNTLKFKRLGMLSKYGFYESYDLSNEGIVRACYAHHQGMSLMGITNYLKNDVIKEYFHENVFVKTFEILLKEKVQVKADIDMKISKYKKYNYEKEVIENDIRSFSYISDMPEVSVLSNKKYCLLMNDRGDSFSRYRTLQLNRYRKITEQDYGMFFYIKDLDTKKIWSNTFAPLNKKSDYYEVVFASDKIKYIRKDGPITTKTEIVVTSSHNAEIRKLTFINNSDKPKRLELTSYTEPILSENPQDVAHRVFNSMFLESKYLSDSNSLVTKRVSRDEGATSYMLNRLIIDNPLDEYSYETDRFNFVGRGYSYQNPRALDTKLTNHVGANIEPVMALRNSICIEPNGQKEVYFISGFGRSMEQLNDIISSYNDKMSIENAFKVASVSNIINTKVSNLSGEDMRIFNTMLNYLYQTTRISVSSSRKDILRENALSQSSLWKFGVSGDRPIILANIKSINNLSFVMELLKAFEYFKNKSIFVDIIILNSEEYKSAKLIRQKIEEELYHIYTLNSFYHTPGAVTIIDLKDVTREELTLLKTVPRLYFEVNGNESLKDMVDNLQRNNKVSVSKVLPYQNNIKQVSPLNLSYDNSYGGFKNNGREYVIYNKNTPTPWSNVISNNNFGTIVTNNGCGYTYSYNSGEYKITSWTNEMILNDKSEGFIINDEIFDPEICTHGFGYSILESETDSLKTKVTEFVARTDSVKIYLVSLTNKTNETAKIDLTYYMNPTLGNFEEKTSRHILSELFSDNNYLKLRNVYSINFSDVDVFMSSSEKITSCEDNRILVKSITNSIEIKPNSEKMVVFTLGCARNERKFQDLIYHYSIVDNCLIELDMVKKKWDRLLGNIQVKTSNLSLDYMLNGWYLYQALSSRIMARAGFYQVSGAFGYRDQLQDAMNICIVNSEFTKTQILINASHQFEQGDVLHWWHEANRFGLRSRYKDDYLWLVYATIHYLDVTDDYSILDEMVPYIYGEELTQHEAERGISFNYTEKEDTLFNHCLLAINYSMSQIGIHGLPLMGGGDWNDGMNKVGIKGKGESVWLGFFLYEIIDKFTKVIINYSEDLEIDTLKYEKFNKELKKNLNTNGFDNDYYLRAYFDNGDKLGSYKNKECKIDLISQAFSILSGVADKDKYDMIIDSVEKNLVDKDAKIIKLLDPAFDKSLNNPGYIKSYPKGIRENGGQYTHATSWYIMALIKAGYKSRAYDYYQMINPVNRSLNKAIADIYKVEPYVVAADIYSSSYFKARGGWTWYTGSAAWYYRVGIEEILGFKRHGSILKLDEKISSSIGNYEINYKYMDATYNIKVIFDSKNEIVLNGKTVKEIKLESKGVFDVYVYRRKNK